MNEKEILEKYPVVLIQRGYLPQIWVKNMLCIGNDSRFSTQTDVDTWDT